MKLITLTADAQNTEDLAALLMSVALQVKHGATSCNHLEDDHGLRFTVKDLPLTRERNEP